MIHVRTGWIFALLLGCGGQVAPPTTDATVAAADAGDADLMDGDATAPPDGSVYCARNVWCDPTSTYCWQSGLAPGQVAFATCISVPPQCLPDPSCACVLDASPERAVCPCEIADSGILVVGCFEP